MYDSVSEQGLAQNENKPSKPYPLVILIERNPWLAVTGSDSPTFALYETGLVVFLNREARRECNPAGEPVFNIRYFSVILDEKENADLLASLSLDQSFRDLKENYTVTLYDGVDRTLWTFVDRAVARAVSAIGPSHSLWQLTRQSFESHP